MKSGPTSTTRHQNLPAGPVPKHVQLREILRELVLSGQFPGGQLPSERVLADRYGVSRITVRTAIEQLIADGHVIRIRGRGTFATQAVGRAQLCSVTERAAQQGVHLQTKVLGTAETTPPATIAEALGLADGQPAYQVRRLRIADGVPMAVESGWYPPDVVPGLLDHDLTGSLYGLLDQVYGVQLVGGTQTVAAERACATTSQLLDVEPGNPVLVVHRVTWTAQRPVEDTTSWCRNDKYQVTIQLDRHSQSGPEPLSRRFT